MLFWQVQLVSPPLLTLPPHLLPVSCLCILPCSPVSQVTGCHPNQEQRLCVGWVLKSWLTILPWGMGLGRGGAFHTWCKFYGIPCNVVKVFKMNFSRYKWVSIRKKHPLPPFGFSPFSSILNLVSRTRVRRAPRLRQNEAVFWDTMRRVLLWVWILVGSGAPACECATLFCNCSHFENCTLLEICQPSSPRFRLYPLSHL